MIYAAAIVSFLLFWALASAVLLTFFNKPKPIDKLKFFDEDNSIKEKLETQKKQKAGVLKSLSGLASHLRFNKKRGAKLETDLMKADLPVTVDELLVIKILSSSALAFLALAVSRDYIITSLVFILVWNIPRFVISRKIKERIKLFDGQLSEGITIISNSLKAGYSFLQAVAVVSDETPDPLSKEFKKMLKEMKLGIAEEDALKNLLTRMDSEDLRLVINAILIQKDIGGNLSEILDNISGTISDRQKIRDELKTLTAQGRMSGIIVMLIPVFLGGIIYLMNKTYIIVLFTTPAGIIMLLTAAVSEAFGYMMIRKIVNIEM